MHTETNPNPPPHVLTGFLSTVDKKEDPELYRSLKVKEGLLTSWGTLVVFFGPMVEIPKFGFPLAIFHSETNR